MAKPKPTHKATSKPKTESNTTNWATYTQWLHLTTITILFWFLYNSAFDHKPDMNGDNYAYYILGKRIASGQGFTNATDVEHKPHTHFPPGYPYFIAGIMKLFSDEPDTINFCNGLLLFASLVLLYFLAKQLTHSPAFAFVCAVLVTCNSHLLRASVITMSEIPFLFVTISAIYLLIRANDEIWHFKNPWLYLSVVLMAAAYYTKTTAVALVGGAVIYFLFSKKWKEAGVVLGLFTVLAMPLQLRNKKLGSSHMGQLIQINPYKPELGNLTIATFQERIINNVKRYISTDIPSAVTCQEANTEKPTTSWWLMGVGIITLVLFGIYRLRDYRLLLLGYIGGTLVILFIWPDIWGGIRFILPLLPIAILVALWGIVEGINMLLYKMSLHFSPYILLLIALMMVTPLEKVIAKTEETIPPNYSNYFEIAKWCKQNLPKDAIISARKPDMFIYYSDRTCIGDKPSLDDKEVLDFFRKNGVDYVVLEQLGFASTAKYLLPAIQKNQDKFTTVLHLENPDTYLLKFSEGDR